MERGGQGREGRGGQDEGEGEGLGRRGFREGWGAFLVGKGEGGGWMGGGGESGDGGKRWMRWCCGRRGGGVEYGCQAD